MNLDRSAATLLIALPIAFNAFFFLLGRLFGYPAVSGIRSASYLADSMGGGMG